MKFSDYNEFFVFLDSHQELLTKYAYLREFYNASVVVRNCCSCKRTARVAAAKQKYIMNANMIKIDDSAQNDIKILLDNQIVELYNDGQKLVEF